MDMKIYEIEGPKSPEQLRIDQLKASSKRASDAVKMERERQKAQRAQKADVTHLGIVATFSFEENFSCVVTLRENAYQFLLFQNQRNAAEPEPKVRLVPTTLETVLAVIANALAVTEPVAVPFAKL